MGIKDQAAIEQAIVEAGKRIYGVASTNEDSDNPLSSSQLADIAKNEYDFFSVSFQQVSGWLDARNQFKSPSQKTPGAKDFLLVLSVAKIVLLEGDQSDVSLLNLARSVLSNLNTYVLNNGLDQITSDPIEQKEIYAKLQALQGLERASRLPVAEYKVGEDPFANTRNAINSAIEGIKNYFDPIPSIRHSMTTRVFHFFIWGALIIPFFPFVMPIGFLRGAYLSAQNEPDNPYNHRAKVIAGSEKPNLATRIVVGFVNGLTAAIFEPLRFIVSFDQWSPENQRRFNRVENGLFNVLFFPAAVLIGLVRAVRETFTNLGKMWRGEFSGKSGIPLYGASVIRAFPRLTKLGAFLQFLLLPVDLGIGAVFNGLRVLGIIDPKEQPSRYERFVYGVATAVWVGFLSVVVLAPAVAGLGGVIGAFFYGIIGKGSGAVALSTIKASVGWAPGMYAGIGAKLAASTLAFKEAFTIGIPKLVTAIANINFAAIGPAIKGFFVNSLAVRLSATFFGLGAIGYTVARSRDNSATSSEEKRTELFDQAESDANTARADQARAAVSLANASTLGASTTPTTTTSTTPSASTTATATTTPSSSTASPVIINPVTGTTPTAAAAATNTTTDPTATKGSSATSTTTGGGGGFTLK